MLFSVTCAVGADLWPPTVGTARLKATSHDVHGYFVTQSSFNALLHDFFIL